MSFSDYYKEEFVTKTPSPYKEMVTVNLMEYKEIIIDSVLSFDKKILLKKITEGNGEIPIFCEELQKFFMCDFTNKKKRTREIKSREDKELCGVLLNGMIVKEHKRGNSENVEKLKNMNLNWEAPTCVYKLKH